MSLLSAYSNVNECFAFLIIYVNLFKGSAVSKSNPTMEKSEKTTDIICNFGLVNSWMFFNISYTVRNVYFYIYEFGRCFCVNCQKNIATKSLQQISFNCNSVYILLQFTYWYSAAATSHTGLMPPTMTPCTQPKRVGSGSGSFCSSSSSSELSLKSVVSSYKGGLKSSWSSQLKLCQLYIL